MEIYFHPRQWLYAFMSDGLTAHVICMLGYVRCPPPVIFLVPISTSPCSGSSGLTAFQKSMIGISQIRKPGACQQRESWPRPTRMLCGASGTTPGRSSDRLSHSFFLTCYHRLSSSQYSGSSLPIHSTLYPLNYPCSPRFGAGSGSLPAGSKAALSSTLV